MEMKFLGITLTEEDIQTILFLFENKGSYNNIKGMPEIEYEPAIKHINPILSRNTDSTITLKNKTYF